MYYICVLHLVVPFNKYNIYSTCVIDTLYKNNVKYTVYRVLYVEFQYFIYIYIYSFFFFFHCLNVCFNQCDKLWCPRRVGSGRELKGETIDRPLRSPTKLSAAAKGFFELCCGQPCSTSFLGQSQFLRQKTLALCQATHQTATNSQFL